ncbi:helix-turn-helix domain-containing protein [Acetobacterium bakii]|uniref:Helix-turn-helix domain-containing protein n=1 Tax=Acetobacterium bakii TaxID=52689 RepID=A0A0L6TYT2_9FIRM|nr:helix-turn-helix domain-containing protein [Acetobacterium bakii]KNZ41398.1 hypothetical protein AKG39_12325 [Acetobacterium bakii]
MQILATPREIAKILGIPVTTIRHLYRYDETFPFVKIRERYYIPIEKAKTWVHNNIENNNI